MAPLIMILYPAIDLKDGQCVRLEQGEMDRATVFSDDPGDMAAKFKRLGFQRLHVVDLNGAFAGQSRNGEAVDAILAATDVPVQLGGGTNIGQAVSYCEAKLVKVPTRTLFILVSDFYEGGPPGALVAAVKRLAEARVKMLGVAALDETGRADFDKAMAGRLADVGMPVSAVTPDRLADWVGEQLA